jgi:hypothetical protein
MHRSIEWMTFSDGDEIVVQVVGKLEKLKLFAHYLRRRLRLLAFLE